MSKLAVVAFLAAALMPAFASGACSRLSLGNVAVQGMTTDGSQNHYRISGIVRNNGSDQASNALQTVDIYKGPEKLDSKSIPQLKAGASYNFTYESVRSSDAGNGTT